MDAIDALLTPAWLNMTDRKGRKWKALALIAPLRGEDEDPLQLAMAEDLDLVVDQIDVVKR